MIGDLFDTAQEILTGQKQGAVLNSYERRARDCASELDLPQLERKPFTPIGLKNQGATCYLNSLLQALYFTPQLRNLIFSLPLCGQTITQRTNFVTSDSKFNFLMGFQKLFSEMQLVDGNSISTQQLNKAFGWQGAEHLNQQDIHQALRIILDALERALIGTQYQSIIFNNFKGKYANYIQCLNCNIPKEREESFFDLLIRTKDVRSITQSLFAFITPERLEGDNKYYCQTCDSKQDSLLGIRLKILPTILIFGLSRFEFDFQRMDRVKINTLLQFDLEQDMRAFLENENQETIYQLYAVIIHRGSAYGGHYFAYVRDVLGETNWQKNIQQKLLNDKKQQQKQKQVEAIMTQEQKKRKQQNKKQQYPLVPPNNIQLLHNWYDINDSCVTPISAQKLTTQYSGAESAYILFYRRKGLVPTTKIAEVPKYFSTLIQQKNAVIRAQREHYNIEKQHIILKINNKDSRRAKNQKVSILFQQFAKQNEIFINQQEMNSLKYYPNQLTQDNKEQTLQQLDVVHNSVWRTIQKDTEEYQEIRNNIGKEKIPIHINILYKQKMQQIIFHQHKTLLQLRLYLEEKFNISYENQVIKVASQLKKQVFVTDDTNNDEMPLLKLNIIEQSQLIINQIKDNQNNVEIQNNQKSQQSQILSIIVERDDQAGMKRYYVSKTLTLHQLLDYIKKMENIQVNLKRRLRWLNGNRLFYIDQYTKTLYELNFQQELVKFKLQKGQIPIKGDICNKIKIQSKHLNEESNNIFEIILDPNETILHLKKLVCEKFNLDPSLHKFYKTDWLGDPVRPLIKQTQTLFEASFANQQILCLRDNQSLIPQQLLHFNLSITTTGFPDDCQKIFDIKIEQTKTLRQFKQLILTIPKIQQKAGDKNYKYIRVRELKRDYMFGNVFKNNSKTLKALNINQNRLVVQVLDHEEQLNEDDIVLILKKRCSQTRLYLQQQEFIFKATKNPKINELKEQILLYKGFQLGAEQLRIVKYYLYDFQWAELNSKNFNKWLEEKSKKKIPKNKGENNKNKNQEQIQGKKQNKQNKNKQGEKKKDNLQTKQKKKNVKHEPKQKKNEDKKKEDQTNNQQNKQKITKPKTIKPKPMLVTTQAQQKFQGEQNLRKVPFLIKDGDLIGYGFTCEILENDDFQTQQDLNLRRIKELQLKKIGGSKKQKENPFTINVDF